MAATDTGAPRLGLLDSLRRAAASLIEIVRTRLELAVTEIEEQKLRAAQIVALSVAALFFAALAIIFGTLAVVMAYWDRNPVAVLGGFAALYLALAIVAGAMWRARAKARPRLFAATLAELARDGEELNPP
jgi:uncharacterized membrane protein YqjE